MDFNQPGFLYIEKRRPFYLQNILARYGKLIYTDIDTVWKKDPRPFLTGIYDFWGQVDGVLVGEPFFKWVYRSRKAKWTLDNFGNSSNMVDFCQLAIFKMEDRKDQNSEHLGSKSLNLSLLIERSENLRHENSLCKINLGTNIWLQTNLNSYS